jgi:hypothetical protein
MQIDSPTCANGHPMIADDLFCGDCGAPFEADLFPSDPEWAKDPIPDAGPACPNGHPNPPGNDFCAACGSRLVSPTTVPSTNNDALVAALVGRKLAAGLAALFVIIGVVAWFVSRQPSADEKWQARQDEIAAEQEALPQGTDAWDKVAEACSLDSNTVMTDYAEVNRSDFDAVYEYEDMIGDKHYATVDLNDYGAITWINSCNHIDGLSDQRVDIDW